MMETASTSDTLVNFYQTARRYNPEDSHLHTRRRENLKSYYIHKCRSDAGMYSVRELLTVELHDRTSILGRRGIFLCAIKPYIPT
jgi:hypothetical protein